MPEMPEIKLLPKPKTQTERPKLHKVILLNDDYTPRDFVVAVLKAVFRMTEGEALGVMMTAHRKGACVVAVYTQEVAETKARQATDMGAQPDSRSPSRPKRKATRGALAPCPAGPPPRIFEVEDELLSSS
jgi:ATP-dependent Clp protease adaptor protein ClpS